MQYRVRVVRRADYDIESIADWYADQNPAVGRQWLAGIRSAIESLKLNPERCGLAHETHTFPFDIREMLYGSGRRKTHRILFRIREDAAIVEVLAVRHAAQRDFIPDDLEQGDLTG